MTTGDTRELAIGELAEATGLSATTLRYYEDEGLIPMVQRNGAGHRRYRPDHVRWVGLLDRLRTSGMSIARMRRYAELAVRGDETAEERGRLLRRHRDELEARIGELQRCLEIVRKKIDLYEGRIDDPTIVWDLVARAQREYRGVTAGIRSEV
ncbi:MAG: MerR family transcriptional regulator [Gemmatimonadota bacterium]